MQRNDVASTLRRRSIDGHHVSAGTALALTTGCLFFYRKTYEDFHSADTFSEVGQISFERVASPESVSLLFIPLITVYLPNVWGNDGKELQ